MSKAITKRPDPRVPAREECVVRHLLERYYLEKPNAPFAVFWQGETLTFADMYERAKTVAAGLAAQGVKQGDNVTVWLPNGLPCLEAWFGINWLGAVYVPINTAYKGGVLEHVLKNADASVIIVHADLLPRLQTVALARLETAIVVGATDAQVDGLSILPEASLKADPESAPSLERPIEPWDLQSIIYTSGTTGPSKGVMSSYAHLFAMSGRQGFSMLQDDDRYMCNLPLFHVGGTIPVMGMLARGGSVSFVTTFSTENFWPSIIETETTVVLLLGAMATFVAKLPEEPGDKDHPLRTVIIVPLAENAPRFAKRFGVTVYTLFNMTEISTPLVSGPNPLNIGVCGRPREGVEVRLVDSNDCEVERGETGELLIRTDAPWAQNSGYFNNAEATAAAWRNGWFHTGDAFRVDGKGNFVFVDRMKDAIRRRGENISSFEVESEIAAHPSVNEVAVVSVPSELSEDEVMCVVAPAPGKTLEPFELIAFLEPRLAYFMIPRYVRIVKALPRTPTEKIQKHILRQEGVTPDAWDRDVTSVRVSRKNG